jgi:Caspase domain
MKYALLITSNECLEETTMVQQMLLSQCRFLEHHITILLDATREEILHQLHLHISMLKSNDIYFLYYAGNGTNNMKIHTGPPHTMDVSMDLISNTWSIHCTQLCEIEKAYKILGSAIIPSDVMTTSIIHEEELYRILRNLPCPTLFLSDSFNTNHLCEFQYSFQYLYGKVIKTIKNNLNRATPLSNKHMYVISFSRNSTSCHTTHIITFLSQHTCPTFRQWIFAFPEASFTSSSTELDIPLEISTSNKTFKIKFT